MGVPVLTLAGTKLVARQGVGIMMNAGLPEWIATDQADYVRLAVTHAQDLQALSALRKGLRERMRASPIFDAPRFAGNFTSALSTMWERYAASMT